MGRFKRFEILILSNGHKFVAIVGFRYMGYFVVSLISAEVHQMCACRGVNEHGEYAVLNAVCQTFGSPNMPQVSWARDRAHGCVRGHETLS